MTGYTEQMTGQHIAKAGEKFYHFSEKNIKKFAEIETCFFTRNVEIGSLNGENCYEITILSDRVVYEYGIDNEIRFVAENISVRRIGKYIDIVTDEIIPVHQKRTGRTVYLPKTIHKFIKAK